MENIVKLHIETNQAFISDIANFRLSHPLTKESIKANAHIVTAYREFIKVGLGLDSAFYNVLGAASPYIRYVNAVDKDGNRRAFPRNLCVQLDDREVPFTSLLDEDFRYGDGVYRTIKYGEIHDFNYNPLNYLEFKHEAHEDVKKCDKVVEGFFAPFYGVELEVQVKDLSKFQQVAKDVHKSLGADFAMLKHDGSLRSEYSGAVTGFEIVTAPATLSYHKKAWEGFFNHPVREALRAWDAKEGVSCGMHVHISKAAFLSPHHMGKMACFINAEHNKAFMTQISGRNSERYAAYSTRNPFVSKILAKNKDYTPLNHCFNRSLARLSKYEAINFSKDATVEIRIFRGNVSKVGFFKNLEFCASLFEYSKLIRLAPLSKKEIEMHKMRLKTGKANGEEMNTFSLAWEDYIKWLEKDTSDEYKHLKLWLSKSRLMNNYKAKKITDKTPKTSLVVDEEILKTA